MFIATNGTAGDSMGRNAQHGTASETAGTPSDMEHLLGILDSPWLNELRHEADSKVLLHRDVMQREFPEGVDAESAWRLLTAIRHQTASILPFESYADIGYSTQTWYTVPRSMSRQLKAIEAICAKGSAVDVALGTLKSTHPVMGLLEEELAYALGVECTPVSIPHIHEVFAGGVGQPEGIDRIIVNFHSLVYDGASLARRDVTPGLIEELYYRLIEGAEDLELSHETIRSYRPLASSGYFDPLKAREAICGFANGSDEALFHPLLRLACAGWMFWDFRAVPNLNAVVEILLRHVLARKWGCPALAWVPFNRNDSNIGERVYKDSLYDCGYGLDCTFLFCKIVEFTLQGARRLAQMMQAAEELEESIDRRLTGQLNPRQRAIVANALQSPQALFRIEPHRQRYGITYPTARSDFLQLEKLGYLEREHQGRAFAFRAAPGLEKLLDAGVEGKQHP